MKTMDPHNERRNIVVIGNGMVGQRFCEQLVERDTERHFRLITFCEEPRAAYDRVGLTSFFAHRDAQKLMMAKMAWYEANGVDLHVGDIDRQAKVVRSDKGVEVSYDAVVLATGSFPFVPPVPGIEKRGVFVYRTIEDLERIIDYGNGVKRAAVIGGGLLGLEAAKAAYDLGLETHVVEFAPRLMPRQIDDAGSRVLVRKIEDLGVRVHLNKATQEVLGNGRVAGMRFQDGDVLDVDMIIVSAGIRPRDDLARACGIEVGERGGVAVNDLLQTSDPSIYAIGEVALHGGMIYGLVAPGYEMAETVATNLTGGDARFQGADLSTKLKLMGVDVASFGDYEAGAEAAHPLTWEDPFDGIYKKLLFSPDGTRLLGGVLVGDAGDYGTLSVLAKSGEPLPCRPNALILGSSSGAGALVGVDALADSAQICSCNNVTKGAICDAMREQDIASLANLKAATRAGSGCGGRRHQPSYVRTLPVFAHRAVRHHQDEEAEDVRRDYPPVRQRQRLRGVQAGRHLHPGGAVERDDQRPRPPHPARHQRPPPRQHAARRPVLGDPARAGRRDYPRQAHRPRRDGTPVRSLHQDHRRPAYRSVRRPVAKPAGHLGEARGRGFRKRPRLRQGAAHRQELRRHHLVPLRRAGFGRLRGECGESLQRHPGAAQDQERRVRLRECAEAQGKDFGLVATERGYNLYVGGNGGAKPRHADLLAADLDEETAIRYIDRFLMYYI